MTYISIVNYKNVNNFLKDDRLGEYYILYPGLMQSYNWICIFRGFNSFASHSVYVQVTNLQ